MPTLSTGDLAQTLLFNRHSASLKSALQTLSTETVTGLVTDKTARVAGDYGPLAGLQASLTQLDAYHAVTSDTASDAGAMQTVLTTMADHARTLGASLLAGATGTAPVRIDALGVDAGQRLQSVMSALNTRVGGRSVFAGTATGQAAVTDADTMMTALTGAVGGAVSSADVETAVSAWFADPAGFAATVYRGGAALAPVPVSADETATLDVTALDPGIVSTLKGLAMAALLGRGVLAGSDVARADLAQRAGTSLAATATDRVDVQARLGTVQASLENAATRNDAEKTALQSARLDLLSVDPYETATKLQQTQAQLETLYALTARMSRLSLVDFLQ